jgi:hypothetical protein
MIEPVRGGFRCDGSVCPEAELPPGLAAVGSVSTIGVLTIDIVANL